MSAPPKRPDPAPAGTAGGQAYHVLTAPITARGNAVNHKFSTVSQVNDERFLANTGNIGHQSHPPNLNGLILRPQCDGVEP